jgi:transcriptional regulator with XRE-family HTH domain
MGLITVAHYASEVGTVPERAIPSTPQERETQARVLSELRASKRERADNPREWDLTRAAARIGVSASSLSRYESGDTILPTNYLRLVARAYGVPLSELLERLGLLDDDEASTDTWDMAAYLRGRVPEDTIAKLVEKHKDEPLASQKFAADGALRMTQRAQRRATGGRNRPA